MFLFDSFVMDTPLACQVDITPPTFAGIVSATPQPNGSIRVGFAGGTDALSLNLRYRIFIAQGVVSAAALFNAANRVSVIEKIGLGPFTVDVYTLGNLVTPLAINQIYTFGVRCVDSQNNVETNTVTLTATSSGVLPDCLTTTAAALADSIDAIEAIANTLACSGTELVGIIEDSNELTATIEDC